MQRWHVYVEEILEEFASDVDLAGVSVIQTATKVLAQEGTKEIGWMTPERGRGGGGGSHVYALMFYIFCYTCSYLLDEQASGFEAHLAVVALRKTTRLAWPRVLTVCLTVHILRAAIMMNFSPRTTLFYLCRSVFLNMPNFPSLPLYIFLVLSLCKMSLFL